MIIIRWPKSWSLGWSDGKIESTLKRGQDLNTFPPPHQMGDNSSLQILNLHQTNTMLFAKMFFCLVQEMVILAEQGNGWFRPLIFSSLSFFFVFKLFVLFLFHQHSFLCNSLGIPFQSLNNPFWHPWKTIGFYCQINYVF